MKITIASKNNEKEFDSKTKVINIGTEVSCHYKFNPGFKLVLSLQQKEDGKWQIVNTSKSDRVLFKGQPIKNAIEMAYMCKLMFVDSDEFINIKMTAGGLTPKIVPGSLELANRKSAEHMKKAEPQKTISMIEDEELNEQDIETLYGKGVGAQTKIKIDRKKIDIERRRALISKEIAYKSNFLRAKLGQNELIYGILNILMLVAPFVLVYILKDVIILYDGAGQTFQSKILFAVAILYVIMTMVLQQGQFLTLQNKSKNVKSTSSAGLIQRLCMLASGGVFLASIVFAVAEAKFRICNFPPVVPGVLLITSFLSIFIGVFSGFIKNIISETGEELDSYESREDFQAVVKDYQQWISLYVNNITRKKLKDISNSIFNLQIRSVGEYLLGAGTAPFLAYGVSQVLADCFPEAACWIRITDQFKFSPIFLPLASLMIIFAFHSFSSSFATTKRLYASNVLKQDGFSDYNVHGVVIHGVESSKNLKKEARKYLLMACLVVFIEMTMNISYFMGVMGGDVMGMALSCIAAMVPTAILIMETTLLGNTKFDIIIREELLEKVDKEF